MIALALVVCVELSSVPTPEQIQARAAQLDHFTARITETVHNAPHSEQLPDAGTWNTSPERRENRVSVVRPVVLDEPLQEDGTAAMSTCLDGGGFTRIEHRVHPNGRTLYTLEENWLDSTHYNDDPVLQVLDNHLIDAPVAGLSMARLFAEYQPDYVGEVDGLYRFDTQIVTDDRSFHVTVDLNDRATPMHVRTETIFLDGLRGPAVREMFTTAVQSFGEFETPAHVLLTVYHPLASSNESIFEYDIADVQQHPGMTITDICVAPELQNSIIRYHNGAGDGLREYDESGVLVRDLFEPRGGQIATATVLPPKIRVMRSRWH